MAVEGAAHPERVEHACQPILMLNALGDLHSAIVPHERTDTPRDRMNEQERCPYEHGFAGQRCIA